MAESVGDLNDLLLQGQAALNRGEYAQANECFARILDEQSDNLTASIGLAIVIAMSVNQEQGLETLRELQAEHPSNQALIDSLGAITFERGLFSEAESWLRKSIRLFGFASAAACNLGMALVELGRFDEANAIFKRYVRLYPDNISARYHLGLCQLLAGDYAQGWAGFELRNAVGGRADPTIGPEVPRWEGQPLAGKSLLLLAEQGLGDRIQFARYATLAAEFGATVYLKCDPSLIDILGTISSVQFASDSTDAFPDLHFQVPLLSMPKLFETTVDTIPETSAYIFAPEKARKEWAARLQPANGALRVGLVWAGNPDNKTDRKRSVAIEMLSPLLRQPGVTFCSLQVGPAAAQLEDLPADIRPGQLFPEPMPFTEVAAALCSLDLVITVDTAIAHLAGALGVTVWTMISYVPDWRWGQNGQESKWYDSMRLFRQPTIGDWQTVIKNIRNELVTLIPTDQ